MPAALVLGGGGSLGDFEVGAVRYLYERGLRPSIISGCSVGALNGAKLAETADPMQAIAGLEQLWLGLRTDADMWRKEPWVEAITNLNFEHVAEILTKFQESPAMAAHMIMQDINNLLSVPEKIGTAQALLNLDPIRSIVATSIDPEKIRRSGIKLRVAAVALESGRLRFVTETGQVLERSQGSSVMRPATEPGEACWALWDEVNAIRQSLATPISGLGPEPIGRLRVMELADVELAAKERELRECMAANRTPLTVPLREAVVASASIPLAFRPVRLGREHYVDGGVREMLPIEAALDAGADEVYAIAPGTGAMPPSVTAFGGTRLSSFAQANIPDIAKRVAEQIMPHETLYAELNPPGGWDARITVIQPSLSPDIHNLMTIDPGLIRIQLAHGYMRADDVMQAKARAAQQSPNEPTAYLALADEYSEVRKTNQIVRLRAAIWDREHAAHSRTIESLFISKLAQSTGAPTAREQVRTMKRDLRRLIEERRRAGGALPADADRWWQEWEQHPWPTQDRGPWEDRGAQFVRQSVPARMTAGRRYQVSVTMRNTGIATWVSTGTNPYRLGSHDPTDNRTWGLHRVELPATTAMDGEVTFAFSVTAPAQPGNHVFRWRMVQEMVTWFGDATPPVTVQVTSPQLRVTTQPQPVPMNVSTRVTVSAVDAESGAPVSGQVLVDGVAVGTTNVPFDYVFRTRIVRSGPRLDPVIETIVPTVVVRANGYPDTPIDFGFA